MSVKTATLVLAVSGCAALAACSSPSVVTKNNGQQVVTPDEPEYNDDTGFYEYEKDGKKVQVNKDRVDNIEEVK